MQVDNSALPAGQGGPMTNGMVLVPPSRELEVITADIHEVRQEGKRAVLAGALRIGQLLLEARPLFVGDQKGYLRWAFEEFTYRQAHVFNLLKLAAELQRVVALPPDTSVRQALAALIPPGGVFTSETSEWYTPESVIERVVDVLGAIDLDPCADPDKQVPAGRHFTVDDDGLARLWSGRVYMNPPYGDEIVAWVHKLADEVIAGNVPQAIALVPARTDTAWWQSLRDCSICFVRGRLKFSGHQNSAPFPSAAAYFGERRADFAAAFADMGDIWERRES